MLGRLKAVLPASWFQNETPVLDALLSGLAAGLALAHSLIVYAQAQTRIDTASDGWLDLIAADFFGTTLRRRSGEMDDAYRIRIVSQLPREKATRKGLAGVLTTLTGRSPVVFEPERPADTGAWGKALGYGAAGGWGSTLLPAQAFVTAFRPSGSGIPSVAGYGIPTAGYHTASQAKYADMAMILGAVTDADIYAAVDASKPAGITVWTRIIS
jgi:hypothetical protein